MATVTSDRQVWLDKISEGWVLRAEGQAAGAEGRVAGAEGRAVRARGASRPSGSS